MDIVLQLMNKTFLFSLNLIDCVYNFLMPPLEFKTDESRKVCLNLKLLLDVSKDFTDYIDTDEFKMEKNWSLVHR